MKSTRPDTGSPAGLSVLLAALLLLVACTPSVQPSSPPAAPAAPAAPTAPAGSAPPPDGSVHVVGGTVRVDGGPGSVAGGTLRALPTTQLKVRLGRLPVVASGAGVDLTVPGGRVQKPLTLTFPAVAPGKRLVPAVARRGADRKWELRAVNWDGQHAALATGDLSSNVLVWLDPSAIATSARRSVVKQLTRRTPSPGCNGGAHSWSHLRDDEDLVHACLTNNDRPSGVERVELRLAPKGGSTVQVDIPKGIDYVTIKGQSGAFRRGLARLTGLRADRQVFLAADETMTIGWRRPPPEQAATVRITASPRAMAMSLYEGLLDFDGISARHERAAAFIAAAQCEHTLGRSLLTSESGVINALQCLGGGAAGNVSDPAEAMAAARRFLGPKVDSRHLDQQIRKLTSFRTELAAAGHLVQALGVLRPVRSAVRTALGHVFDQLRTALHNGGGATILLTLRRPPPGATLAMFAGTWFGHTRGLTINRTGRAREDVGNGCCDPVVNLTLRLSRPRGTPRSARAAATVVSVKVHDRQALGTPIRVGQTGTLTLRNGEITESITGTNYCNAKADSTGICGA